MSLEEGFPRALDSAQPSLTSPSPLESAEALFIRRSPRRDDSPAAGVKVVVLKKRRHSAPPEAGRSGGSDANAEGDRAPRVFTLRTPATTPPQAEAEPVLPAEASAPPRRRRKDRIGHDTRARLISHVLVELPPPPPEELTGLRAVEALRERMQRLDALLAEAQRAAAFVVEGPAEGWTAA